MFDHSQLGSKELIQIIRKGNLPFAGNKKLKIYGQLKCASGKRMKISNRVFFSNEDEALSHGYRPCGHCMRFEYQQWKNGTI
jgi:methylphosphotriester-DNA--protein-cysteine methyltransferase